MSSSLHLALRRLALVLLVPLVLVPPLVYHHQGDQAPFSAASRALTHYTLPLASANYSALKATVKSSILRRFPIHGPLLAPEAPMAVEPAQPTQEAGSEDSNNVPSASMTPSSISAHQATHWSIMGPVQGRAAAIVSAGSDLYGRIEGLYNLHLEPLVAALGGGLVSLATTPITTLAFALVYLGLQLAILKQSMRELSAFVTRNTITSEPNATSAPSPPVVSTPVNAPIPAMAPQLLPEPAPLAPPTMPTASTQAGLSAPLPVQRPEVPPFIPPIYASKAQSPSSGTVLGHPLHPIQLEIQNDSLKNDGSIAGATPVAPPQPRIRLVFRPFQATWSSECGQLLPIFPELAHLPAGENQSSPGRVDVTWNGRGDEVSACLEIVLKYAAFSARELEITNCSVSANVVKTILRTFQQLTTLTIGSLTSPEDAVPIQGDALLPPTTAEKYAVPNLQSFDITSRIPLHTALKGTTFTKLSSISITLLDDGTNTEIRSLMWIILPTTNKQIGNLNLQTNLEQGGRDEMEQHIDLVLDGRFSCGYALLPSQDIAF